jgi:hypothetical protein
MHFLKVGTLTAMLIAIVQAVPAPAAAPVPNPLPFNLANVTVKSTGSVRSGLSKRDIPAEFQLATDHGDFDYVQFTLVSPKTSCMGWDANYASCGTGPWPDQQYADMQDAVAEQCAQDGQLTSSTVGDWEATFFLLTTAFDERGAYTLFTYGQTMGYGTQNQFSNWYFSYDMSFIFMTLKSGSCP